MARRKSIETVLENEIYDFDVILSFNQSDKKFAENMDSSSIRERVNEVSEEIFDLDSYQKDNKQDHARTLMLAMERIIVVRLNFMPSNNKQYAMLQHEIFHAVEFIMNQVGMVLSYDSDEAYSYLVQYYTEKIYDLITD